MKIETTYDWSHYCVNLATYNELSKWFDFLKKNGVYDNTRIILVSDHGYHLHQFDYLLHPEGLDIERLQPLLMVKDFNSHDSFSIDYTFMTNADVPTIAFEGLIDNPINPFTENIVDDKMKKEGNIFVMDSYNWSVEKNCGYIFDLDGGNWWSVHDNIYDLNNWKKEDQ